MASRLLSPLPDGVSQFRQKPVQRAKLRKTQNHFGKLKRSPLRRQSKKRAAESKVYLAKRKAFLEAHPVCEFPGCFDRSLDVHHMQGRGPNYLREETWMAICRRCHRALHNNPNEARRLGVLA